MDIKEINETQDSMAIDRQIRKRQLEQIKHKREQHRRRRLRHKIITVFTAAAVFTGSAGWVYTASAKEVTITEINEFAGINQSVVVKTRVGNVAELLSEEGMTVSDADKLNVSPEAEIDDGHEIIVKRGKQVTIKTVEGETVANVTSADAESALEEAGYQTGAADEITKEGDVISVVTVDEKTEETAVPVDFDTIYTEDASLAKGETKVVQAGVQGEKLITQHVVYRDGTEVSRETLSEEITDEPVQQIIAKGTKITATPEPSKSVTAPAAKGSGFSSDTGSTINGMKYRKKITMQATAYSTSPSENGGYAVSAKGNPLKHGIVAVDPNVIPLGSKVYVESTDGSWVYGVASAEDTGGAIKGNRIDLCYEGSAASVNTFGRRTCNVYILE
ncbi:MAG: G5 domain-containing protein [bacterium]|nr:G5 domain-containing protein [bacterium]